jgi:DNA-binding CsgD family transcriptional regulator
VASGLIGRDRELAVLTDLIDGVADEGAAIMVLGDPGIGKSCLLRAAAEHATRSGVRVLSVTGVQAEAHLAFAGLHQLLRPVLPAVERLPAPQRGALSAAFGTAPEAAADRRAPDLFMIALAALNMLTDVAAERPLLVAVDDAQWLDQASVEVLGFIARRLYADPVGMVFTVREEKGQAAALAGLPELPLAGLPERAAGELLAASAGGRVDGRVSAQVVAGVAGNPLALVELAKELTPAELSGAVPLGWPLRFGGRLEELYLARVQALPADTRTLLLVAAADPTGDPALVYQAARQLGAGPEAGEAAETRRLVSWQPQVRFQHPLIRSAAYYAATAQGRRGAHAALAAVTDPHADPDRRAWHLAEGAAGPDEQVADELQRSADRAQARGGLAAAAALLERSLLLTADPAARAERVLAAAQVSMQAGSLGRALELLATAEAGGAGPLDEFQHARVDLLRGHIAFVSRMGRDAPSLLLKAARRLEPLNLDLARQTYLTAWAAALMAGHLAGAGDLLEVSRAARALPPPKDSPRAADLILDGAARLVTDGPAAAAPVLRQAADLYTAGDVPSEELRLGTIATTALWDDDAGHTILARQVQFDRAIGAFNYLPSDLVQLAQLDARRGDFAVAASLIAESDAAAEATGIRIAPFVRMLLAALRGDQDQFTPLMATAIATAEAEGQGLAATTADWYAAILHNGLGRYDEAFAETSKAWEHSNVYSTLVTLPELIEAATRTGQTEVAAGALAELAATTQAAGTDYALGIEARSRALVSETTVAEEWYREAVDRLGRTPVRTETARAHLVYGEWLRRQRRRRDARDQLRTAFEMFDTIGMEAFAARARAELRATGERARPRSPGARELLTPQEEQIGWLVAEHLSNREIAARLFISASTVEYHLAKIFRKLGVSSRGEVARSLRDGKGASGSGTDLVTRAGWPGCSISPSV